VHLYFNPHSRERKKKHQRRVYIKNVILLKKKGSMCAVNYVLHPSLLSRFRGVYEFLKLRELTFCRGLLWVSIKAWLIRTRIAGKDKNLNNKCRSSSGRRAPLNGTKGSFVMPENRLSGITEYGKVYRCVGDDTCIGDNHQGINLFR
jgi:hypothetical protein